MTSRLSYHDLEPISAKNGKDSENLLRLDSNIPREAMLAMRGVMSWGSFLGASMNGDPQAEQALMGQHLERLGFIPPKTKLKGKRSPIETVTETRDKLLYLLHDQQLTPDDLVQTDISILAEDQRLAEREIAMLQQIINHELSLDRIDLRGLVAQFPFPITQYNYFGQFIAKNTDGPSTAMRHLYMATPFFVRMKSLVEGLSLKEKKFMIMKPVDTSMVSEEFARHPPGIDRKDVLKMNTVINAVINRAHQFAKNDPDTQDKMSFAAIKLPLLSLIELDHIKKKELPKLVAEFFDWLVKGKVLDADKTEKEASLLQRVSLSVEREKDYRNDKKVLERRKEHLKKMKNQEPTDADTKVRQGKWLSKYNALEHEIKDLEDCLKELDMERNETKSLLQVLNDRKTSGDVQRFREEVMEAQESGKRIVFSVLPEDSPNARQQDDKINHVSLLALLDQAIVSRNRHSPGIECMQNASLLLTESNAKIITSHKIKSKRSSTRRHMREFVVDNAEFNQSLHFVAANILPQKTDPKLSMFTKQLQDLIGIPGVSNSDEFMYVVQQFCNKKNPDANDFLEYCFEHAIAISQEQLKAVFSLLRQLDIRDLPDRCKDLASDRFHLPEMLISQYVVFANSYKPDQVGTIPPLFEDLAGLNSFLNARLEVLGMAAEVDEIARHLISRGIVTIVDGTDYHPELIREIAGERMVEDEEMTTEVWGAYVRPTERVIRAFGSRLVNGSINPELQNFSLVRPHKPDKIDRVYERLYHKFLGIDLNLTPDLSHINRVLSDLTMFDNNSIVVLRADNVKNLEQYRELIDMLEKYKVKVILIMREAMPGVPSVVLQPFVDAEIPDRLQQEAEALRQKLGIEEPINPSVMEFAAGQIKRMRETSQDPLNLNLHILSAAAQHARMGGAKSVEKSDVIAAISPIFHLPDAQQMHSRLGSIDKFTESAPLEIFGQKAAIEKVASRIKSHILGLRDPTRPLTMLLPGPTGVGKTEMMIKISIALNIPYFQIEGAEFSEGHTVSRLVGSPSGYVGPDEGILFKFLSDNPLGLIFIDEIEKMHPDVVQALMNFFDKATLTAGDGRTVKRPGHIIVGASNAGADKLHRNMTDRELRDLLSESFVDRTGKKRPELVRRFEPIPMLALEAPDFEELLRHSLKEIGNRFGFINSNMELTDVDERAVELLFEATKNVCAHNEKSSGKIGFQSSLQTVGKGLSVLTPQPSASIVEEGLYIDMRHVSRAIDQLAGQSIQRMSEQQYKTGQYLERENPIRVRLVGISEDRIELQKVTDASDQPPHHSNGHAKELTIDSLL